MLTLCSLQSPCSAVFTMQLADNLQSFAFAISTLHAAHTMRSSASSVFKLHFVLDSKFLLCCTNLVLIFGVLNTEEDGRVWNANDNISTTD